MSRRYKILLIPVSFIYSAFLESSGAYVIKRKIDGVPEGARVVNVWYCAERHAFKLTIEHKTFEEVEEFVVPPYIEVREIVEEVAK